MTMRDTTTEILMYIGPLGFSPFRLIKNMLKYAMVEISSLRETGNFHWFLNIRRRYLAQNKVICTCSLSAQICGVEHKTRYS